MRKLSKEDQKKWDSLFLSQVRTLRKGEFDETDRSTHYMTCPGEL